MSTPDTLDLTDLLLPVSGDQPAGPELRNAPSRDVAALFFTVRDLRKKAIDAERRLRDFALMSDDERKAQGSPDDPDWASVRKAALDALGRSKDLWIAAWLIEAQTRLHGFAGFRDGVRLVHDLCEAFWQDLHPQPGADRNMSTRFAQLAGLDGGGASEGTLIAPLLTIPITGARTVVNFSLADYRDAVELERKPPDIRRRRTDQGAVTIEMFNEAVAATNGDFFRTLRDDVEGASQALTELTNAIRDKEKAHTVGGASGFVPPSSKIREVLDECLRVCRSWTKDAENPVNAVDAAVPAPAPEFPRNGEVKDTVTGLQVGGDVESRQEAFQTLLKVADYFRRAEPHSPVSYALEQAVRWGRMSLPDLLSELISDTSVRDEAFKRAGIPQPRNE
jgi:type VI secretion system protein ImpA